MNAEFTSRHALRLGTMLALASFTLVPGNAAEQNWPIWRGPLASGAAPDATPPLTWSETNHVKWKVKLPGTGSATPIVWGNRVFIQTAIPAGKKAAPASEKREAAINLSVQVAGLPQAAPPPPPGEPPPERRRRVPPPGGGFGGGGQKPSEAHQFLLVCLDRATGKTLWQKVAREEVPHEGHHPTGSFASASPVTDGQRVVAFFGSHGLHCYDLNGQLLWEKDLGQMRIKNSFGEGSSPAIFGNTVVVNWDHEGEDFIVAFALDTGRELWRTTRTEETSWATPLVVTHQGKPQVVTSATGKIRSYDLATGKLLWECRGMTANAIPSPVAQDGLVYCISGFRGNALLAIRLGRTGDLTDTDAIAWRHNKSTPYVPSPLLYAGKLYFFSNNNGLISCFSAKDGQPLFEAERVEALPNVYASPVGAAGRVYLVGRNGATVVLKQSDKFEVLATNRLEDGFDASPALAGRDLFLRGHEHLYCLAEP